MVAAPAGVGYLSPPPNPPRIVARTPGRNPPNEGPALAPAADQNAAAAREGADRSPCPPPRSREGRLPPDPLGIYRLGPGDRGSGPQGLAVNAEWVGREPPFAAARVRTG